MYSKGLIETFQLIMLFMNLMGVFGYSLI